MKFRCVPATLVCQTKKTQDMTTEKVVIRYFDIRGKAEAIRLLLEVVGQEYTVCFFYIIFFTFKGTPFHKR